MDEDNDEKNHKTNEKNNNNKNIKNKKNNSAFKHYCFKKGVCVKGRCHCDLIGSGSIFLPTIFEDI